jgi:hypothetical protein
MAKKLTKEEAIKRGKAWCQANYERGADTMVEAWDDESWEDLWDSTGSYTAMMVILRNVAAVYRDRIADAKNSVF